MNAKFIKKYKEQRKINVKQRRKMQIGKEKKCF